MQDTVGTALAILFIVIAIGIYSKKHKERLKKNNKIINLQGLKIRVQRVKCPVELCDYKAGEYCKNSQVDLCMLVKNNYDEYGLYCKCFKK